MEQMIITSGFVDKRGHYLVNGTSYEIYDPYTNTITVVVGPPPYTNGVSNREPQVYLYYDFYRFHPRCSPRFRASLYRFSRWTGIRRVKGTGPPDPHGLQPIPSPRKTGKRRALERRKRTSHLSSNSLSSFLSTPFRSAQTVRINLFQQVKIKIMKFLGVGDPPAEVPEEDCEQESSPDQVFTHLLTQFRLTSFRRKLGRLNRSPMNSCQAAFSSPQRRNSCPTVFSNRPRLSSYLKHQTVSSMYLRLPSNQVRCLCHVKMQSLYHNNPSLRSV